MVIRPRGKHYLIGIEYIEIVHEVKEHTEVKTFIGSVQAKATRELRSCISDNGTVGFCQLIRIGAVRVYRSQLLELGITGTRSIRQRAGVYHTLFQFPSTRFSIERFKIIHRIETVIDVSVNQATGTTYVSTVIISIHQTFIPTGSQYPFFLTACQFVYFVLIMTDIEIRIQREIFCFNDIGIQLKFDTPIGSLPHISHQFGIPRIAGNVRRNKQIFHRIPVNIYRTAETFLKETEVETKITGNGSLPFHIGVVHISGIIELIIVAAYFAPAGRRLAAYSVEFLIEVGINTVVTGSTVTQT